MKSLWSATEAQRLAAEGDDPLLAQTAYACRLLGADPALVLHGGGNGSVKLTGRDLLGDEVALLRVKGSGRDMAALRPEDLTALRLDPLRALARLDTLDDEAMLDALRLNRLSTKAADPSVETLMHAFLPGRVVLHTHATALLALCNQPDPTALVAEAFGDKVGIVPYRMSGLALAKAVAETYEANPAVEGLVLTQHGLVTWGDDAHTAYERMITLVSLAERRLARGRRRAVPVAGLVARPVGAELLLPRLRGLLARPRGEGRFERWLLDLRTGAEARALVDDAGLSEAVRRGVATPDHVIRTKVSPLALPPAPAADGLEAWTEAVGQAIEAFEEAYHAYFACHDAARGGGRIELDPVPRVALIPGLGLVGIGADAKAAAIAADMALATAACAAAAESVGIYQPASEEDLFDLEYWSLEQAKLGARKHPEKALARQVVAVTGGGSGIGAATARAFAAQGAEVAILDLSAEAAAKAAAEIGPRVLGLGCDVTDRAGVEAALAAVARRFGGLDVVVSNAGAAWQGTIGTVDDATLRKSFELNFFGHQNVAQAAVALLRAQGTGGALLFNASKQSVNPGKNFGPYGLPKAATLFLMKQYALDHGREGIRTGAVNADRIRTGLLTADMIASRSKARGLSEQDYMAGNLLGREVTAEDVADAFVWLARSNKVTACTVTVDGGNIEASLR
ncbi:bifunctional aldolase/short-chain dehydrogenase [Phaeospirillum tilakii]|uniref:Bifunctional aldolase/short-chain dehydrogenase n=1 Tax=Phaeospirillum tilakii TaxID=741673 RepID=A0ABW5CBM1_9PROT